MACELCNDTGKRVINHPPSGERVEFADGTSIEDGGGFSTVACSCVRDLPAIDGEATWWDLETPWHRVHTIPIHDERIELSVDAEVPRRGDGRRVHRRGNRYYPALISVVQPESLTLLAYDARDYALALLAAAEAADAIDAPCCDPCGHWHPCNCEDEDR